MPVGDAKAELRQFVRLTRAARSERERAAASADFDRALLALAETESWTRLAAFIPTPTEPPILGAIRELVARGCVVSVPVSGQNGLLTWIRLGPGFDADLSTDAMGMPIPASGDPEILGAVDAVLVPAAAVDRDGDRLGWGKGYYDRFLTTVGSETRVVAVVFDADIVNDIPVEAHDVPVDVIVTERDIYAVS